MALSHPIVKQSFLLIPLSLITFKKHHRLAGSCRHEIPPGCSAQRKQKQVESWTHLVVQIRYDRSLGIDPLVTMVTAQCPDSVVVWGHPHQNAERTNVGAVHMVPEGHTARLCGGEGLTDQVSAVTRASGCWRLHVNVGACGGWCNRIKDWRAKYIWW